MLNGPVQTLIMVLSALTQAQPSIQNLPRKEVLCLSRTVWGEARGDYTQMIHVAQVVMNRVNQAGGTSICQVVRAKAQFAGYWKKPKDGPEWVDAVTVSAHMMSGLIIDTTRGATHFVDEGRIAPKHKKWVDKLEPVGYLGNHTYLKEKKP